MKVMYLLRKNEFHGISDVLYRKDEEGWAIIRYRLRSGHWEDEQARPISDPDFIAILEAAAEKGSHQSRGVFLEEAVDFRLLSEGEAALICFEDQQCIS